MFFLAFLKFQLMFTMNIYLSFRDVQPISQGFVNTHTDNMELIYKLRNNLSLWA